MENASKALIMAGGVLLSVIVIGLLLLGFSKIREYPQEQDEQKRIEQIANFNKQFEGFQKDRMYGTDVITALNKAIDNNIKYDVNEEIYDVNIIFTLKTPVTSNASIYTPSLDSNGKRDGKMDITVKDSGKVEGYTLGEVFPADIEYELKSAPDKNNNRINDNVEQLLSMEETIKIPGKIDPDWNYTIIDSGFKQFKRKIFKCTNVEYNAETGRIDLLEFVEI